MRHLGTLLLATLLLSSAACSERAAVETRQQSNEVSEGSSRNASAAPALARTAPASDAATYPRADETGQQAAGDDFKTQGTHYDAQKISFDAATQGAPVTVVPERKVIRNAELTIELDSPADAQRALSTIAERSGGFVVTSESRQGEKTRGSSPAEIVTVEMRVPAAEFDAVISGIRGVGGRVRGEKISGRDVTEEFIDLEARLRAQRALEGQVLEIMKRAQRIADALEVNAQLAQVRSEIERVEGRRRFLDNQSSLSTIKVTLQPPAPLVAAETSGFAASVRRSFGDGVDAAAVVVLALVRIVVTLIPIAVLICLPAVLLWRFARRNRWRARPIEDWKPPAQASA